jgi:hypothetical protein
MMLKLRLVPLVLVLDVTFSASAPAQSRPYTLGDVTAMVTAGVPGNRVMQLVHKSCIGFRITPASTEELLKAGADDVMIAALRSVCFKGDATDVTKPRVVTVTPVAPVASIQKDRNYSYSLPTRAGQPVYGGELAGSPGTGSYYAVEFDRSDRITRIRHFVDGKVTLTERRFYNGAARASDSVAYTDANGQAGTSSKLERDAAGNVTRSVDYTRLNHLSGIRRRFIRRDTVEVFDSTADGRQPAHSVNVFDSAGTLVKEVRFLQAGVRLEYARSATTGQIQENREFHGDSLTFVTKWTYGTDHLPLRYDVYYPNGTWVGSTEFAGGLQSVFRYKYANGQTEERRYSYDDNRQTTQAKYFREGQLVCTFTFERTAEGTVKRTLAIGPNGDLLAEYPDMYVETVTSDGRPFQTPEKAIIHKTTAWW